MGYRIDHADLVTRQDPACLNARAQFEKLVPELSEAIKKPYFVAPNSTLTVDAVMPNLIAVRACTRALCGLAESRVAEGKIHEAIPILVDVVQLGRRFSSGGYLINDMIGVAVQAIGCDAYLGIVDPEKIHLQPAEWLSLTERLVAAVPSRDALVHAIEAEMTACNTTLQKRSHDEFPGFTRMAYLPGYLDRERRIYLNGMCVMLDQAESRGFTSLPHSMTQPGFYDWLSGRTGRLAQMMIPNYERVGQQLSVNRARIAGMATIFGVLTFRATNGRLPVKLSDLAESGVPVVDDQEFLDSLTYRVDGNKATLKVLLQSTPVIEWSLSEFWTHPWCDISRESFVYKFGRSD